MSNYAQAREDFEYLESIAELSDQVELDAMRLELMQNPTKAFAAEMYVTAIGFWFKEHGAQVQDLQATEIANRHGY